MESINTIYNEDCLTTMSRLNTGSVDCVVTSPPYNMNLRIRNGKYCSRQIVKEFSSKYDGFDDNLPIDEFYELHSKILRELLRVSNLVFYNISIVTGSKRAFFKIIGEFNEQLKDIVVWDKGHGQPAMQSGVLNRRTELLLVFDSNNAISRQFKKAQFDRGTLEDVWNIGRPKKLHRDHGAVFPEELVHTVLTNFTKEGDIVYDPFMGTGTTAVVADKLGRLYLGSEMLKDYHDFAIQRLSQPELKFKKEEFIKTEDSFHELTKKDKAEFSKVIKEMRSAQIQKAKVHVKKAIDHVKSDDIKKDVSGYIQKLRDRTWIEYLKDEVNFNKEINKEFVSKFDIPKNIAGKIFNNITQNELLSSIGEFNGLMMPYFTELTISTSNSRRTRAGSGFEYMIAEVLRKYNYSFTEQQVVGGKKVDLIVPVFGSLDGNDKYILLSLKTSLRERWTQVVDEALSVGFKKIFLLTVDEKLNQSKIKKAKEKGFSIVTYKEKADELKCLSFDDLFNKVIPEQIKQS